MPFYSYGSGAVAEFFSGELIEGYEADLIKTVWTSSTNELPCLLQTMKVSFEEVDLDETNSAQFVGYENQEFALVEIVTTNAVIARLKNNEDKLNGFSEKSYHERLELLKAKAPLVLRSQLVWAGWTD